MRALERIPIVGILGLCLFLTGVASAAVTPYRGIVAIDGLGMSNQLYAIVLAVSSVGAALASLTLGYLSDKVADRRALVLACALLGAVAYGLIFLVPTQWVYTVAVCVILPFGAALFSQSFAYARAYLTQAHPARAEFMISTLRSVFTVAWIVTPPAIGWAAATYSVFHVFLVASIAQLCCMIVFATLWFRQASRIAVPSAKQVASDSAGSALSRGRAIGLAGVAMLRIASVLNLTVFPLVVVTDVGGSLTDLGIAASIAAILEVPLMLAWGHAATRWPKEPIIILNGMIFALYLVLLHAAGSMMDVFLLQILNAISTAALLSLTISYVQETIRGRIGLSTSLLDVMAVVATFATAGLFAVLAKPDSYSNVLLAGGAISAVGAGVLLVGWRLR